ncbi:MAG: archaeosortase/exosortase family protein [Candidatus Aenigmatarchaeota archaeon]
MDKRLQKEKNLKNVLWFFLKLNLFLIPFYLVIYFDVKYEPLQILFASAIKKFLSVFGFEILQDSFILYLGPERYAVDISFDCIGWKSAYSLFALVISSPGLWKEKFAFLSKWLPLTFLINFLRVIFALIVGFVFGFRIMAPLHDYVLQPFMIVLVLSLWMLYMNRRRFIEKK